MLGLFLLLPVLSPYVKHLEGSTPMLTGLAVGIYGLTQAVLQIPFGYLSDRVGRKPVIAVGLLIYIAGSILGGIATGIKTMVLARLLQGAGAVSSAALALVADSIREEVRTRAFAQIGASVGLSFAISIVLAPILAGNFGVPFVFYLTALFSFIALVLITFMIKEPERKEKREENPSRKLSLLTERRVLFLNTSIFLLHAFMVNVFIIVPISLIEEFHMPKASHWKIYIPAILISIAVMVPSIIMAEKRGKIREVLLTGILLTLVSYVILFFYHGLIPLVIALIIFFTGFNLLEPTLPSLLTKIAPEELRGFATGTFNTSQFLGAFAGGIVGGMALKHGVDKVLLFNSTVTILWIAYALTLIGSLGKDNPQSV